jgi:hypothetical protein
MSETPNIIQPIKSEIDPEIIDIGFKRKTEREKFIVLLVEKEQEFVRKHKPYSYRCAKADFEAEQERIFKTKGRSVADRIENVKINNFDFDQYGEDKRFKLIKTEPAMETKLMDGIKASIQTGEYNFYQDKQFGNKIAVWVPVEKKK